MICVIQSICIPLCGDRRSMKLQRLQKTYHVIELMRLIINGMSRRNSLIINCMILCVIIILGVFSLSFSVVAQKMCNTLAKAHSNPLRNIFKSNHLPNLKSVCCVLHSHLIGQTTFTTKRASDKINHSHCLRSNVVDNSQSFTIIYSMRTNSEFFFAGFHCC